MSEDKSLSETRYSSLEWKKQFDWLREQEDADFLLYCRRFDLAESVARKAIMKAKAFGKDDPRLSRSLTSLGRIYLERGQFQQALDPLNQALKIKAAKFGNDSADVADIRTEIAYAEVNLDKLPEARKNIDQAKAIRRKINDYFASIDSDFTEGLILEKEGKSKEALKKYHSSISNFQGRSTGSTGDLSNAQLNRTRICIEKYLSIIDKIGVTKNTSEVRANQSFLNEWFNFFEKKT